MAPKKQERGPVKSRRRDRWAEGPVFTSGLIGALVVAVAYVLVMPLVANTHFGRVLTDSAWVGKTIFTFGFWALALLCFKWRNVERLRELLQADLLPMAVGKTVTPENSTLFVRYIQSCWGDQARHPLARRLVQALAAVAKGQSRPEIQQLLRSQHEADVDQIEGSFSLVRTFIWSAPILGFIGTVLGIGFAIGGFSVSMGAAEDLTAVKSSLGQVIAGLAFSFQATFVGLVVSLVLVFATNWRHKAEMEFLGEVGDYCEHHLLSRVTAPANGIATGVEDAVSHGGSVGGP
ncbi:MAG TPA: MotA/TolQ/ExbB proton channel family protein [Candidatus Paceibacterota bacterium]|nr:MotA/TolQ/ExbB proton channel family protein [Candidatus Paceibacterota bacterium]